MVDIGKFLFVKSDVRFGTGKSGVQLVGGLADVLEIAVVASDEVYDPFRLAVNP